MGDRSDHRGTRPGRVARAWRAPAWIGLLVLLDLVTSSGLRQVRRVQRENATIEAEVAQEPYRSADWGRAYWEELSRYQEKWEPYYVYRVETMRGRFVNVTDGVRRTHQPKDGPGMRRPLVFVFGGSAAWGHGVRDEGTLPSCLARLAEERGHPLDVRNFAESGWVNWQGISYLLQQLADGQRPDAVVFYSGVNEVLNGRSWPALRRPIWDGELYPQAMRNLIEQRHRPLTRAWSFYRDTSLVLSALLGDSSPPPGPAPVTGDLVPKLVEEYDADRAVVEALGKVYGFSSLFAWQLTVADKESRSEQERGYAGWLPPTPGRAPVPADWILPGELREAYDAVGAEVIRRGAVDLSPAFDGMTENAFIDWMHPTDAGNERIAAALLPHLLPLLGTAGTDGDDRNGPVPAAAPATGPSS